MKYIIKQKVNKTKGPTAGSLGKTHLKHFSRLESNFMYQQKHFRSVSLSCSMERVPLKYQIIEEKAPVKWCTCSMLTSWCSCGIPASSILTQTWGINSDLTWSQWEFCQANSRARIIKDFGILPVLGDCTDQTPERTNPLLSSSSPSIMQFGP